LSEMLNLIKGNMTDTKLRIQSKHYRKIFFVQNLSFWNSCPFEYNQQEDLVLSFDFAVIEKIISFGGHAEYVDHVASPEIIEKYNYQVYVFFANWYYNSEKQDIFLYRGVEVGSAFRIEIFNDITYYIRLFINLHEIQKNIEFEQVYTGITDKIVLDILETLNINTVRWFDHKQNVSDEYFFPVFQWMNEKIYPSNVKYRAKTWVIKIFDIIMRVAEKLNNKKDLRKYIYIHRYHPTKNIISKLQAAPNVKIVLEDFNSMADMVRLAHLPVLLFPEKRYYRKIASIMIAAFEKKKNISFYVDEIDISPKLFDLIMNKISNSLPGHLKNVDVIKKFFANKNLSVMVTISSLGIVNRLMMNYCKKYGIPIYLIINGFLGSSFFDEAKDGDWINAYGESIKKNYFKDMPNVICLGDPRMDNYTSNHIKKMVISHKPTICIGAAGFSNVDLNSYVAYEFDFLNDIMRACSVLKKKGREMDILIKVRPNGYIHQYKRFMADYYPDLPVRIVDTVPMQKVLLETDFYISIFSQTLFEASCMGISVLYYKKDTQNLHSPFDGRSELVTAFTVEDLINKIDAFYNDDKIYELFKDYKVMEKYIGRLDGKSLERNMHFIHSLMSGDIEEDKQSKSVH